MKRKELLRKYSTIGVTLIFVFCALIPVVDSQIIRVKPIRYAENEFIDNFGQEKVINDPIAPLADIWDISLNFTEPGGAFDDVKFGEKDDASDGPDSYDVPKNPPSIAPYIRAWFDTGFSSPYHELWEEYKLYPDTNKYWNLTVQWVPSDYVTPTTITISWDNTSLEASEYTSVVLYDDINNIYVSDMLVETSYSYSSPALTLQKFKVLCNINQDPVANDDSVTVPEDSPIYQIDVLLNDSDPDGDSLTIISVTAPTYGSAITDGEYVNYTPDPEYNGLDTFSYTIDDGSGGSDTATVSITVDPVNDAPVANNDFYNTAEETALNIGAPGILTNDSDIDGDTITAVQISGPSDGSLTLYSDGSFSYNPNSNFSGSDSFTYVANDSTTDSNIATVFITVSGTNDAPVANDDYYSSSEDTTLNVNAPGVLANDTDIDGDTLTAINVSDPTSGSLTLNSDGSFSYIPNIDFFGTDSFTYRANDGNLNSNIATVYIEVVGVNDDPTANDDTAIVSEDTADNQIDVLVNDIDIDGDSLSIVSVSVPAHGTTTTDGNYTFYTPDSNYEGADTFTYTISDGNGGTDIGTVSVTVTGINDPPIANDDSATVAEDSSNNQINALSNDNDIDGDDLDISGVTQPTNGTATHTIDFVFYTPDPNFSGLDSFSYNISDGNGGTDTAIISITVSGVNDPPVANDDSDSFAEDSSNNQVDVLTNDVDPDGDSLDISSITQPSHGTATYTASYVYYTPDTDYNGPDQFGYTITDNNGGSDSATVSITITAVNDPPNAVSDSATVPEDSIDTQIDVLINDDDPEGDILEVSGVTDPTHGTASFNTDYVYYSPDANYSGSDSFTYTISDGNGGTDSATVSITVTPVNDPPVANNDVATVAEDSTNNQINVLVNDNDPDGDNIDVSGVTDPPHGTATYTIDYVFYTPDPDYTGSDSFTYSITDGNGGSSTATIFVTVTSGNDPPVANDDSATVLEDSSNNQIDVLANDNDPDGDSLDITSITQPLNGIASYTAANVFYTPNVNYNGPDQFSYIISDGNGGTDSATVSVTVTGVNDPPIANDDVVTVLEDSSGNQINVLSNDFDIDGDNLDITSVTQPSHGTVTFTIDYVYYTPDNNYNGPDQFSYNISDGNGGEDSASVTVTVTPVNDAPVAIDDSATVVEDSSDNQINVLGNDNDPDGDGLDVTGVTQPLHGITSYTASNVFYTPDADYAGSDQFSYTISDGNGGTDTATVTLTISGVNDAPDAINDVATVLEDSSNNEIDVLLNDVDVDGDDIDISSVSQPAHGTVTFNIDYVYYTPDPDYTGSDSFTYTITDGNGGSDNAIVSVTVGGTNDPPIANNDVTTVTEDSSNNQIDVLTNDFDPDGDSVDITGIVSQPAHGTATYTSDFIFYSPDLNYNGADQLTYSISDGQGGSDSATVSITITSVNDAPTASDDSTIVIEDSINNQINVLGNDVDIDGDDLDIISITTPSHGSASYTIDFVYYTPNLNYFGPDQLSYTVSDGNGGTDSATIYITVTSVNDPPNAIDDSVSVVEDSTDNQIDVLSNDVDPDGDSLDITAVGDPPHGLVTFTVNYILYTPDENYSGSDQFSYTINDGNGGSDIAFVTVTVTGVNDAPTAIDDYLSVPEDSSNNQLDVLFNDVDPDGDTLVITGATNPIHGTITYNSDFIFYTPDPDYTGSDQLSYSISDGHGGTDSATIYITVGGTNDPPVANDDSATVLEDSSNNQINVLANDNDPDGDTLTIISVGAAAHGYASTDGNYVYYTPNPDFSGSDSFSYTIIDGQGGTDIGMVNILVTGTNDPPVANNDVATVIEDSINNQINVLADDFDIDGDILSIISVTDPLYGSTIPNGDSIFYTPDPNFNGFDQFDYTISDGNGGTDTATVYVTVTGVNDPPVANDDFRTVNEDSSDNQIGVLANDTDPDGDDLDITSVSSPAHGTVAFTVNYVFYTPNPNYYGPDWFSYTIKDDNGASDSASVFITINPINDDPNAINDYFTVDEDSIDIEMDVIENDEDIDNDDLTIISVTSPSHGTATTEGNYTYYTPNPDFNGADSYKYTISDGNGGTDMATVYVTINPINDPPIANDDFISVSEDSTDNQIDVLFNDLDIDGDDIDISGVTNPLHGSAIFTVDYVYYTPNTDYEGSDQFNYSITDKNGGTNISTVFVSVGGLNDPPIANNDVAVVLEDSVDNIIDVLINDIDPDGDNVTIVSVTNPSHGTTTTDGLFVFYSPAENYSGSDSFMYTIFDGIGTDVADVSITVNSVNDPPVANDDYYNTEEDTTLVVSAPGVLTNDTDIDSSTLSVSIVSSPTQGNLTFNSDGSFDYTPDLNYIGTDSFTYRAYDLENYSNIATVTIEISSLNDSPVANDDYYSTAEDTQLSVSAPGVLLNDTDEEGDSLTVNIITNATHGDVTLYSDGSFVYDPDENYFGPDTFTYTANDGTTDSNIATVYIDISSVEDVPIAFDDYYETLEETTLIVNAPGVLSNDTDPDNDVITADLLSDPLGSLIFNSDGSFEYTPNTNYNGIDSFTYWANDSGNYSNIATVFIDILPVNDPPTANDDSATVFQDTEDNQIDVLINDNDIDGDQLIIVSVEQPNHGAVDYDGDYVYYTPQPNFKGDDSFEYDITDGKGRYDTAIVNVTVNAVNHPPEMPTISGPNSGKPNIEYNYAFVSIDIDGDDLEYQILWGDGSSEEWIGPYPENEAVTVSHIYVEPGIYNLQARARDIFNATSNFETFRIIIPRAKFTFRSAILHFFESLLEIFKSNHIILNLYSHLYEMWGGQ